MVYQYMLIHLICCIISTYCTYYCMILVIDFQLRALW